MKYKKSIKERLAEMVDEVLREKFHIVIYTDARDFITNKGAQPKNDICSWEATCSYAGGYVQLSSYDTMTNLVKHGFSIERYGKGLNIFELHQNPENR